MDVTGTHRPDGGCNAGIIQRQMDSLKAANRAGLARRWGLRPSWPNSGQSLVFRIFNQKG